MANTDGLGTVGTFQNFPNSDARGNSGSTGTDQKKMARGGSDRSMALRYRSSDAGTMIMVVVIIVGVG